MKTLQLFHALLLLSTLILSGGAWAASPDQPGPAEYDPRLEVLKAVQQRFTAAFAEAVGFGGDRMDIDSHAPTPFKQELYTFVLDGKMQRVEAVNLIGIVQHPGKPAVFKDSTVGFTNVAKKTRLERLLDAEDAVKPLEANEAVPAMITAKTAKTRDPDTFEAAALTKLEQGEEVVASFDGDEIRFVGAIRASSDCMACHESYKAAPHFQHFAAKSLKTGTEIKEGDLLGAFTYRIKAVQPALKNEVLAASVAAAPK